MKKMLLSIALGCVLSATALAGDMPAVDVTGEMPGVDSAAASGATQSSDILTAILAAISAIV